LGVAIHTVTEPKIYSDIVSVWTRPEVHGGGLPYVNFAFEYPAVIGWLLYASTWGGYGAYILIQAGVLAACVLAIVIALYKLQVRRESILIYVLAAPTMLIYGFYNWDLILVALFMLSLVALMSKRIPWAGFLLGFATASKLYSVVFIPVLLSTLKTWRERTRFAVFCLVGWFLPNLPFMLLSPSGWMSTWTYQQNWGFEDTWLLILSPQDKFNMVVKLFGFFLMGLVVLHITFRSKPNTPLRERLLVAALAWLLFSYVSTPQMALLLLPLFAINGTDYSLFYFSEVANVSIILTWYTVPDPVALGSIPQIVNLLRQGVWFIILARSSTWNLRSLWNWSWQPLRLKDTRGAI
jgi:uncharacterized membrane protein